MNNNYAIIWDEKFPFEIDGDIDVFELVDKNTFIYRKINDDETGIKLYEYKKGVVILCELSRNINGDKIDRQDLYGIKLAQKLRQKGLQVPVLFVSFLSRQQINNEPKFRIINTIGHSFLQLPSSPDAWQKELDTQKELHPLELFDIQQNYCNPSGIAESILHSLHSNLSEVADLKSKLKKVIKDIYILFDLESASLLTSFNNKYSSITAENKIEAVEFIKTECRKIIVCDDKSQGKEISTGKWKVLLLDDEINEDHPFVKELKKRKVDVVIANTVNDAKAAWDAEAVYRPLIMVVVVDYRLEETGEIHQKEQGYRFIQDSLSKVIRPVKVIAYSSMRRQFLFRSLKYYGVHAEVFSKIDFPIDDSKSINFICDEIVRLGEENWDAVMNMPDSAGWKALKESYINFINSTNYLNKEKEVSYKVNEGLKYFKKRQSIKSGYQILTNPYSMKTKKEKGEIVVDLDKDSKKFLEYYTTRRLCIGLSVLEEKNSQQIMTLIKGSNVNNSTAKAYISHLGLKLDDYPFGLTIEEQNWLQYDHDLNIHEKLSKYWTTIEKIKTIIQTAFSNSDGFLQKLFKSDIPEELKNGDKYLLGKESKESEKIKIYFGSDFEPYIRTVFEIKVIINKINESILNGCDKHEEKLKLFLNLNKSILRLVNPKSNTKKFEIRIFTELFYYIQRLKNPYSNESYNRYGELKKTRKNENIPEKRSEEYTRKYCPWDLLLPKGGGQESKEALKNAENDGSYENIRIVNEYLHSSVLETIKEDESPISNLQFKLRIVYKYNKKLSNRYDKKSKEITEKQLGKRKSGDDDPNTTPLENLKEHSVDLCTEYSFIFDYNLTEIQKIYIKQIFDELIKLKINEVPQYEESDIVYAFLKDTYNKISEDKQIIELDQNVKFILIVMGTNLLEILSDIDNDENNDKRYEIIVNTNTVTILLY